MKTDEINQAIESGVDYLLHNQKRDGSFINLVSIEKRFKDVSKNQSVFPTSLILSSLNKLPESRKLKRIKDRAAKFLLSQKNDFWSWNYWKRNSRDSIDTPYPDDLDDTCCAAAALIEHKSGSIPTKAIVSIINLLTFCESNEGGPYHTWITPVDADKGWKDTDLAVNNNIAFFLSLQEVALPSLIALTENAIATEKYRSPYYYSPYSIAYFISRWYGGRSKNKIISFILKKRRKNHSWGNPLETALAVNALINLGYERENLKESVEYIFQNQMDGGSWDAYPFVIERIEAKNKYYSGSKELTTVFCLEALWKFLEKNQLAEAGKKTKDGNEWKGVYGEIMGMTDERFSQFDPSLRNRFLEVRKKILQGDKAGQVTLLPYFFQKALGNGKCMKEDAIAKLGAASLYGWAAYTIYDSFFDREGNPEILSVANVCLRELNGIYHGIFSEDMDFLEFFNATIDRIDDANAWEVANCRAEISGSSLAVPRRLPRYGTMKRLADRSIGHALGPIAVLRFYLKDVESPEAANLLAFFENYIIARQLNDDAHDWEDDLKKGLLSPAVVLVLEEYFRKNKIEVMKEIDLKGEIEKLQEIFWHKVIQKICSKAILHAQEARKYLRNITAIEDASYMEKMVGMVEGSARMAIEEQREMLELLKEYQH